MPTTTFRANTFTSSGSPRLRRLAWPCGLLLATACGTAASQSQDACALLPEVPKNALVDIPFDTVDGRIYVQARVNGRGPFRFAIDTGASGLARADASLVSALGLGVHGQAETSDGMQTKSVQTTHLQSLELGALVATGLEVITRDYSGGKTPDAAFAGIIAREFFADGLLVIDYPGKTLRFTRSQALAPGMVNVLAYERAFRVPVRIGTLQTTGNLDTGANVAFVLPTTLYQHISDTPLEQAGRGQLTNGDVETQRATLHGPFRIGNSQWSDVEVRVVDGYPELLVGAHALQHRILMIDQRSKTVALCD